LTSQIIPHHGFHPRLFTFNPSRGYFFLQSVPRISPAAIHNSTPLGVVLSLNLFHEFHPRLFIIQPLSGLFLSNQTFLRCVTSVDNKRTGAKGHQYNFCTFALNTLITNQLAFRFFFFQIRVKENPDTHRAQ